MTDTRDLSELRLDPGGLYRETVYTDRRVGAIRVLSPVTRDGADDPARAVEFEGETTLLTPAGPVPLRFEIEAQTLAEALERFGGAAEVALERTLREIEELRRQAASSIVVPGRNVPGLGDLKSPGPGRLIRP